MLSAVLVGLSSLPFLFFLKKKSFSLTANVLLLACFFSLVGSFNPGLGVISLNSFFTMDPISVVLVSLTFWISSMSVYSMNHLRSSSWKSFMVISLVLNLVLVCSFCVDSMIIFFVLFEASIVPTLLLILMWGYQPERIQASLYLLFYTLTASLPLLVNLIFLSWENFHSSFFFLGGLETWGSVAGCAWWGVCILAFLVKMPIYGCHLWLPKAHVEAPVAGSMILAGVLLKLGGYGFLRMSAMSVSLNNSVFPFLSTIFIWGAVVTGWACMRQTDMKALIAYSSVSHMGLIGLAIVCGKSLGWGGALLTMVAHGLCSASLFYVAYVWSTLTNSRSLMLSKGMVLLCPSLALVWFLLSCINMSAPPTMNFLGEVMMVVSFVSFCYIVFVPVLVTVLFFTGAYSLYLFSQTSYGSAVGFITGPGSELNLFIPLINVMLLNFLVLKPEVLVV